MSLTTVYSGAAPLRRATLGPSLANQQNALLPPTHALNSIDTSVTWHSAQAPAEPEAAAPVPAHVRKALQTKAQGVPALYANAWEWAAAWIASNGVTLPPDTSEYRSLRNWFCYQVSNFKKKKLSPQSEELLQRYGIDLSLYRADNTGRGRRLNDRAYIEELRAHFNRYGSYNLTDTCSDGLQEWQQRLLTCFYKRGTSKYMVAIAAQLPGLSYGLWLAPSDASVSSDQFSWWARAAEFRICSLRWPAYRGKIDPGTPSHLRSWASEQISLAQQGVLSSRQRGELLSLNLIARQEHRVSQQRAVELALARGSVAGHRPGNGERDVTTFLGAAMLAYLVRSQARLASVYARLSVTPAQFEKMQRELAPHTQDIQSLCTRGNLTILRKVYRVDPKACAASLTVSQIEQLADVRAKHAHRITQLARLIEEIRSAMVRLHVRQDLMKVQP